MNAEELRRKLKEEKGSWLLVDVRETDEVADEPYFRDSDPAYVNIPLSILGMLPKEEIVGRLETAAGRLGKPLADIRIVMGCRSGGRSRVAQEHLSGLRIVAENLEGGRIAWGEPL